MKIKEVTKKALCLLISALLLNASLPVQIFAQVQMFTYWDLLNGGYQKLIDKGYAGEVVEYTTYPLKVYELSGGENLDVFGMPYEIASENTKIGIFADGRREIMHKFERRPAPYMEGWEMERPKQMIEIKQEINVDGKIVRKGDFLEVTYTDRVFLWPKEKLEERFIKLSDFDQAMAKRILENPPVLTQEELRELVIHDKGKLFGPVDRYAKFARVQAAQAKGGEKVETILKDGFKESRETRIAKPGDWIVTNPNGERYIPGPGVFEKKYEKALDLGEGWFKSKRIPQDFRLMKQEMSMQLWGKKYTFRAGSYINVTDMNDIYAVAEDEFIGTYKTIKQLYQENFNVIERLLSRIETKLAQRDPKFKGIFFRKFLKNDTKFMEKELTRMAEKRAAKLADKEAKILAKEASKGISKPVNQTALRTFGGVFLGVGLYFAITLLSAQEEVKGQTIQSESRNNLIKEAITNMEDASKRELAENVFYFANKENLPNILDEANHGEGRLLEQMGLYEPTILAAGLTEDEAAEAIIDSAIGVQVPFTSAEKEIQQGIEKKLNNNYQPR